ncbi:two-component sensor histidine kinase [Clostridium bowmanii]|uniref:ATP-binding protein n=1 Tax=Clostridium bowmanii TaxID=132925 RepID=UPI001C0D2630|nr:ATP-binding protein [Clostridium bowmanii]MBU3188833.1 GHKL domain-containing protein [Clostridium bowmanii]MCA1073761.1 two-component sensor histidine kinase [Clostridium bowmanii]
MLQQDYQQEPTYIIESKKRCIELGMNSSEHEPPKNIMAELKLAEKKEAYKDILEVVKFFSEKIIKSLEGTPIVIVISDENGYLLDMLGDETIKSTIDQLGIKTGIQFSEEDMGTNVVSLTLKQNHPVQLIGTNHYHTFLHNSACYGVPFHYMDIDNAILGSICIMTAVILHNPFFLMTLTTVVDSIERELLLRKQNNKLNILNQIMVSKNKKIEEQKKELEVVIEFLSIDITTEIKSNKSMEKELKSQEEFLANISHELKTPLNVIYSTIQLFNMYCKNGSLDKNRDSIFRYINSMMKNCHRLSKLINNIVDLSKIEAGFFELKLSNNNIVEIVEEIVISVSAYTDVKGLSIIFDTDTEENIIACDPEKIERIVLNLISNAIKFSDEGNEIFVKIQDKNEFIEISVKDNGIGIEPNQLDMIFNRFKQVNKSLSRNAEGTGIGLSLVKAIVELHQGRIYVESELGKGSEFIVELPKRTVRQEEIFVSSTLRNKTEDLQVELSDVFF